jgi:nitrogen regulation protein NR(I)
MSTILIADDERSICEAFAALVESEGHTALIAANADEAVRLVRTRAPTLAFLDVRMPGKDGLAALAEIKAAQPQLPVIVMTAYGTLQTAASALGQGAFDYLGKPIELDQLRRVLRRAVHSASGSVVAASGASGAEAGPAHGTLVGQSPAMQEIFKLIVMLSGTDLTVLIQGESGVGKELVARALHTQGSRAGEPFIALNCAAIPESLIEAELFGHERGAFTDAREARRGRFEAAGRGTLFLDEIGEMPRSLQSKLLRVLQERIFERVGSVTPTPFAARLVAASNRDLAAEVRAGRFREDLYHRLNIVTLHVPALRDRRNDIPVLLRTLLARANTELGRNVRGVEPAALERLQEHSWPGNVRELEHTVKRAVLVARGDLLSLDDLEIVMRADPAEAIDAPEAASAAALLGGLDALATKIVASCALDVPSEHLFDDTVRRLETALVEAALRRTQGNRAAAAKLLGINRATLRSRIAQDDEEPDS